MNSTRTPNRFFTFFCFTLPGDVRDLFRLFIWLLLLLRFPFCFNLAAEVLEWTASSCATLLRRQLSAGLRMRRVKTEGNKAARLHGLGSLIGSSY